MEKAQLKNYLQNKFNIDSWIQILRFLVDDRKYLSIHLDPKDRTNELTDQRSKAIFRYIKEIGILKTSDGADFPIFDVELNNTDKKVNIEYNKVGVNSLLKRIMSNNAYKGLIVTFHYPSTGQDEWRFSFISKSNASDFFAEIDTKETNPKKYTYIFGTKEEHRTAIDRLFTLQQSRFRVDDFFDAFNVEPVSKGFFNEYKNFYIDFAAITEEQYYHIFEQNRLQRNDETDKEYKENVKRDVRNFVKRLLSRIVFLYFLQKKKWIASVNKNYEDGDMNFLENLFNGHYGAINKNEFYNEHLTKLFFEALNMPNRKGDLYTLPNGNEKCIPFLNGGLFEEEQEPKGHRNIIFPAYLFEELFRFFNSYNFTIYENSPQDHTIAVDPEMLGHIFENLLEDNKDKGAFYTPKEIVQYMTQESLIQYLYTSFPKVDKTKIEQLVRDHNIEVFEHETATIKQIDKAIDKVKICDPAIGSGAFPMGLLQEIFSIKALINYQLGFEVWSPATVKQNIIQNSIYGVDIEIGAVDIARLRFWLSLVVDEDLPKPLPNLDYKIMQGDSLLESFKGIDLSKVATGNNLTIAQAERDLFGNLTENQLKMTFSKTGLAEKIQDNTKKYFTASNAQKPILKKEIDDFVFEFIDFNIELREQQLQRLIAELENGQQQGKFSPKQQKAFDEYYEKLEQLSEHKKELYLLQQSNERPYFLWHLFFSDVFENGGFDIVIGNPPYGAKLKDKKLLKIIYRETSFGNIDSYKYFIEKGLLLKKEKGCLSYITSDSYLEKEYFSDVRCLLLKSAKCIFSIKLGDDVFGSAKIPTAILFAGGYSDLNKLLISDVSRYRLEERISNIEHNINKIEITEEDNTFLKRDDLFFKINYPTLISLYDQVMGVKIYQVGKGKPKQTRKEIDSDCFVQDKRLGDEWLSFIDSGIKRYQYDVHSLKFIKYGEWLAEPRDERYFVNPKIVLREVVNPVVFAQYIEYPAVVKNTNAVIIKKNEEYSLKYLLAIINSKLFSYYVISKSPKGGNKLFPSINSQLIKRFPVANKKAEIQYILENLVEYIILLKKAKEKINEYTTNNALALMFEETIDAMVYELYFEEHLKELNIDVIDLVRQSLDRVVNFPIQDQINYLFKEWNEYESELRNRIILQRTRSEYVSIIEKAFEK